MYINNAPYIINSEKSIIIGIIYYILKNIKKIQNTGIFIKNNIIRLIIQKLFPNLNIIDTFIKSSYCIHIRTNNLFSNCSNIYIDYLKNYNKYICSNKVKLLPWFDIDDPIILYEYNKKYKYNVSKITKKILNITLNRYRDGILWDTITQNYIFSLYEKYDKTINYKKILKKIFKQKNNYYDGNYIYIKQQINELTILENNLINNYNKTIQFIIDREILKYFMLEYCSVLNTVKELLLAIPHQTNYFYNSINGIINYAADIIKKYIYHASLSIKNLKTLDDTNNADLLQIEKDKNATQALLLETIIDKIDVINHSK
jgi:hypothetical protein